MLKEYVDVLSSTAGFAHINITLAKGVILSNASFRLLLNLFSPFGVSVRVIRSLVPN
jgi:hypothetical protein